MSKKIYFRDEEKLKDINPITLDLWKKYIIDMSLRELSEKTISGYKNDLEHWWIYIYDNQNNQCVIDLTEDDIIEFLYFCKSNGNNSRRMARRMSSIAAFYKFLRKKKIIKESPMEFIDRPKKHTDIITQTFLTKEQIVLMKEKLKEYGDLQLECYALFSLSTMARITAISNTKWEQINFVDRIVSDVIEKEGYIVDLYFSKEVKDLLLNLKKYREENNINDNGYVFFANYENNPNKISISGINNWIKKIGNMIDVPTLHAHDFRHSGATLLKNAGMNLEDISKLLNHKSTDVTNKFYIKDDVVKIAKNKDRYEM